VAYADDYTVPLLPTFLHGYYGEAWGSVLGTLVDGWVEGVHQALLQRVLSRCSEDALPLHAADRLLFQLPGETAGALRARLGFAWTINGSLGTPGGMVTEVKRLGYTNATLYENIDWSQPPSPGFNPGDEWWRFWVLIRQPHRFGAPWFIGDGTLVGLGKAVGITGNATDLAALVRVVRQMRSAHTISSVIIVLAGQIIGGGWTVGGGTNVGANTINLTVN